MKTITREQVQQAIDESAVVINVLPNQSFQEQHIPGSINIPLEDEEHFVDAVEEVVDDPSDPVVVYCAGPSCDASSRAAGALEDAGFSNVRDYEGGLDDWESAGEPLEGNRPATEQV